MIANSLGILSKSAMVRRMRTATDPFLIWLGLGISAFLAGFAPLFFAQNPRPFVVAGVAAAALCFLIAIFTSRKL